VFRSGNIAVELRGNTLTEERLVAETLGATSHRKNMRIGREPIHVTVIRDDVDVAEEPVEPAPPVDDPVAASDRVPVGRLGRLLRGLADRWGSR